MHTFFMQAKIAALPFLLVTFAYHFVEKIEKMVEIFSNDETPLYYVSFCNEMVHRV